MDFFKHHGRITNADLKPAIKCCVCEKKENADLDYSDVKEEMGEEVESVQLYVIFADGPKESELMDCVCSKECEEIAMQEPLTYLKTYKVEPVDDEDETFVL